MEVLLVSHFHWDREWYREFQAFRARLVDAVDRVLDLLAADPGYRFVLDGQAVVLDDYLLARPGRRAELDAAVRGGRLAVGPWYVQPDSLLPGGEAHVRNLLIGRAVASAFGPVSRVAYVPDSFGHPAQFPQLFAEFGLDPFVYWRGNGAELDRLGPVYRWEAPDGSAVTARWLGEGYFGASGIGDDVDGAVERLEAQARSLAGAGAAPVVLMNGFDHALPDARTGEAADALARRTGWQVRRALLDDLPPAPADLPSHRGELLGARVANLLPGVWSARLPLKLRNRRCETLLDGWAEPWAALGRALGLPDERPSLGAAWRALLQNQAHDSIGGCSVDAVHEQMAARYDEAEGLARETATRTLERLAGRGAARPMPWTVEQDVVVFNPSPHPRTDVVRVPLDADPQWIERVGNLDVHPLALAVYEGRGFGIDGLPTRTVASDDPARVRFLPDQRALDVEFVAADVPAFGCRRYRLVEADPRAGADTEDAGREITAGALAVRALDDGTLAVRVGDREFTGLLAVDDTGDRGDSYDFDPVGGPAPTLVSVACRRRRHPSGIEHLRVRRVLRVPAALDDSRDARTGATADLVLDVEARVAPGVPRVDLAVRLEHAARDHRLRLAFPTGAPADACTAATTFDVTRRPTGPRAEPGWVHPPPATFPHQGWVHANGLTVVAPGLPEAEVTPAGVVLVTLVRAVGWLSRFDLRSRPIPAGPVMEAPGGQVPGPITARLALLAGDGPDPAAARDAELGLAGVFGGPAPLLDPGRPLLALEPGRLLLSACKPAEDGDGLVVRVLNPGDEPAGAVLRCGFPVAGAVAARLDETPLAAAAGAESVTLDGGTVRFAVPPHALRTVRLVPG